MARPMPRLAPVTSALRPVNCKSITVSFSVDSRGRDDMRTVLRRPGTGGRGRYPRQGVADQATVGGAAESVRPVAGLDVDHRAAPGGLGPGDEVTGGRVLPRRTRRSR